MLEIEELILKETPFLSIKDITQEEWVALDYELEVYDRAGKDYDLKKLPMLPFILREIHNNETTFFNIPGFIRDGFQFRKLVAIYNPRLKRILKKREDMEMNRVETTKFLGELLKSSRLSGIGKYWASEVSIDAFTSAGKGGRVDFMQFEPPNQCSVGALEKGIFICYEVKSCKEDVYSGNGLNFYGEKNYIVTTMQCYRDILPNLKDGTFTEHLRKTNPDSSTNFGIMVAVPIMIEQYQEFKKTTPISKDISWRLEVIQPCTYGSRKKSLTEMLFYMVRSGH